MALERVERRLAAILAADVAGYSRLIGADEEGTLARLRAIRRELADPKIAAHNGRVVKTTGDGLLVEFASVVDALRCAVALQQALAEGNAGTAPGKRIELRIGVHQADIVAEDDDIFGDGVNIAARLEALAEPGGICVSARVQEDALGRLDLAFEDMGEPELKNIARKVRVYRVFPLTPTLSPQAGRGSRDAAAAGEGQLPASAGEALTLPDKPSVAVLAFANMSSDPEQEFLADGIAEDVITALSRYPSLFVIARNSSFTYKGRAVEIRQVGRELGVRYVLEGSLRKSGSRIRVTAQLVEAETGNHVWAERYDRDLADIFAVQDEISQAVTIAIAPAISQAEQQRAMRKPPDSLDAWAAYQRGLWHQSRFTAEDVTLAEKLFRRAIDLDPSFGSGYVGLASIRMTAANQFLIADIREARDAAEGLARRAIALDPTNAEAYACLAGSLTVRGDLDGARREADRAVALCPNLASAQMQQGVYLINSGQAREGLAAAEKALRLDPRSPIRPLQLLLLAIGHYYCREYQTAIEAAREATRTYPDYPRPHWWLAAALGQLGRTDEAKVALEKAVALAPRAFEIQARAPFRRPEDHAHMVEGLRKAGWEG